MSILIALALQASPASQPVTPPPGLSAPVEEGEISADERPISERKVFFARASEFRCNIVEKDRPIPSQFVGRFRLETGQRVGVFYAKSASKGFPSLVAQHSSGSHAEQTVLVVSREGEFLYRFSLPQNPFRGWNYLLISSKSADGVFDPLAAGMCSFESKDI